MKINNTVTNQILFFIAYQVIVIFSFYFYGLGLLRFAQMMTPDANTHDNNVYLLMIITGLFIFWIIVFGFIIQTICGGIMAVLALLMSYMHIKSLRIFSKVITYIACFWFAGKTLLEAGKFFNLNLTIHTFSVLPVLIGFIYLLFFVYHFEDGQVALLRFYTKIFRMEGKVNEE